MGLTIFLGIVFLICVAMLWTEGFWGNALTLINLTLAGIVATGFFEPVADLLDKQMRSFTYMWDFLALWGLFVITFSILRLITDRLSRFRVRFAFPIEMAGKILIAMAVGGVMVSFVSMTLHTAPLGVKAFGGVDLSQAQMNTRPGITWLRAMKFYSTGSLNSGKPFDANNQFIQRYQKRRKTLEGLKGLKI